MASILMVGLIIAAILDTMRQKEGAFGAVWVTLGLSLIAAASGPLLMESRHSFLLTCFIFIIVIGTLFLVGVWITLQFRWIQLQYPVLTAGLEKTLVIGSFPVASGAQGWAISALAGASTAPFASIPLLCTLYWLLALPLDPSFSNLGGRRTNGSSTTRSSRGSSASTSLQLPDEAATAFFLACTIPAGTYLASHFSGALLTRPIHFWSLLILASAPVLTLGGLLRRGLWWLGEGECVRQIRVGLLLASLAILLAGLEARVVFFSYGQYIRLPTPWNYIVVTAGVYGIAALGLLHAAGALSEALERTLLGPVVMGGAALAALALGLPLWVLPAPLGAAAGLAVFYDTRRFSDYVVFAVGVLLSAAWLVHHHFWFLDVHFAGFMSLRTLCMLLLVSLAVALLLGGAFHASGLTQELRKFWNMFILSGLVLQASLLALVENVLVTGVRGDEAARLTHGLQPLYPRWLVLATTISGLLLVLRTKDASWMRPWCAYLLTSVYVSKSAIVVVGRTSDSIFLPTLGLVLVALAPVVLFSYTADSTTMQARPRIALMVVFFAGVAVVYARFAVFDLLRAFGRRRPSEAALLGTLLLLFVGILLPLVSRCDRQARQRLALVAGLALLLLTLRPPLPTAGGALCPPGLPLRLCPRLWDEGHVPAHERDAVGVWGSGLRRGTHAPLWLLVAAGWLGLAGWTGSSSSFGRSSSSVPTMLLSKQSFAIMAASGLLGSYIALEHGHGEIAFQILMLLSTLLIGALLVALKHDNAKQYASFVTLAWLALFPLAFLAAFSVTEIENNDDDELSSTRLFPDSLLDTGLERVLGVRSALFAAWAAQAAVAALALKLCVERHRRSHASYYYSSSNQSFTVVAEDERLASAGLLWAPSAANVATALCAGCCAALGTLGFRGAGVAGGAAIAPVFLLLTRDPVLAPWLTAGSRRRYLVPVAVASLALNLATLRQHVEAMRGLGDVISAARDGVALVLLVAPQMVLFAALATNAAVGRSRATSLHRQNASGLVATTASILVIPQGLAALLGACLVAAVAAAAAELSLLAVGVLAGLALLGLERYQERKTLQAAI